tara:strand:- start:9 stop:425 length:417 start_codon:yes stop_codon:yes gene_type:complete
MIDNYIEKAFDLLDFSYCPYSKFRVGCLIVTKDNRIYNGVNIENASYGLTMCAERCAVFNALSNGVLKEDIDYVIIVSNSTNKLIPCGGCLQVFSEFLNMNTRIIIQSFDKSKNSEMVKREYLFKDLLPNIFGKDNLS